MMREKCKGVFCAFLVSSILLCNQVNTYAEKYEYDDLDRVTKVTYDDGSYVEYHYDANGNIKKVYVDAPEATEEKKTTEQETTQEETTEQKATEEETTEKETTSSKSDGDSILDKIKDVGKSIGNAIKNGVNDLID